MANFGKTIQKQRQKNVRTLSSKMLRQLFRQPGAEVLKIFCRTFFVMAFSKKVEANWASQPAEKLSALRHPAMADALRGNGVQA